MRDRNFLLATVFLLLAAAGLSRAQTPAPPSDAGAARQITVKAHKYAFEPATIEVRVGEKIELTLVAEDRKHGFICGELGVDKTVFEPGKDGHVTFTAMKAGTYAFKCASWCGFGHGRMVGSIVVSEK